MLSSLRSIWIWFSVIALIVLWLPLLTVIRIFDRDPVRYRTGLWFRRLGRAMIRVNPVWKVRVSGETIQDPRRPYVVVSNHQSIADIPVIAKLPWEMKWIVKKEMFRLPFAGWMLRLAGDIPVDRKDPRSGARTLLAANKYLQQKCSVMFFPEGTRSMDGRVGRFNDGAFHLAIKAQVPILPLAVEGSIKCIPKKNWKFGKAADVFLRVFPPVNTIGLTSQDAEKLKISVRTMLVQQIAEWRGVELNAVDLLAESSSD
jgi:1-acyl-sn-glycerol-3-phosphate acyltransferase